MTYKVERVQITDRFEATVEITGNVESGKVVFVSHGFGVQRDSRGMFIDIENVLKNDFLGIRFDYNEIQKNGNTQVASFSEMS